jgi:RNA polymerase sigma-70 factor (ECF subfamily)
LLRVYPILNELPAVYRSIITWIDIHELDYAEAAEVMNIPLGTVKSRLAGARSMTIDKL